MTSFLNRLKIRIFVPMNKVTDIDLQWYEAVRQDNYPAFEKLFQKFYDPLCRYAQGLLADVSLAEDVVLDMFIHFWENRIKLQVKDSLRSYFYTCIRHRALKYLQKQAIVRKHNPKLTEFIEYLLHSEYSVEEEQEIERIKAIMQEVDEEDGDYVVDEKNKIVNLTEEGVRKVEQFFHIDNYADVENLELQHNVTLALRAHSFMTRDKVYVV